MEGHLSSLLCKSENQKSSLPRDPLKEFKVVLPRPGFCLKCWKINSNEKYFINVCQTEAIPAPDDISEEDLDKILASETPSDFRIPMSISEPRVEADKSGNPADVCDIAINPTFLRKIETSLNFRNFFIALIAEAMSDKFNVQLNIDKALILNNRKFIGTLVTHHIRKILTQNLIQEIDSTIEPQYKLRVRVKDEGPKELHAEFHLPHCVTKNDFTLDVGEDRLLLESSKYGYSFDKFVNYTLDPDETNAIFDKTTKMLQVRIPIIAED